MTDRKIEKKKTAKEIDRWKRNARKDWKEKTLIEAETSQRKALSW